MTAERDIAGFVLPFIIGSALSMVLKYAGTEVSYLITHVSFLLIFLCLTALVHKNVNLLGTKELWTYIITLGLCCGTLCSVTEITHIGIDSSDKSWLFRTTQNFSKLLKTSIASIPFSDKLSNAIATALITGDRNGLNKDLIDIFRQSGASHILALSGMHLGIIYSLLKILLWGLGNSRNSRVIKSALVIFICGFYTLSTGAGASIFRAFIFILTAEIAMISGRHTNLKTTLLSALLIQLILTPGDIKNVGFQLSYAAVAGIAFIYPQLRKIWPQNDKKEGWTSIGLKWVWNCAAMSIACQITTAPVAFAYFGTFPKYFLITNLLAIPLTTVIIPSSILTTILSTCGLCPDLLVDITEVLINRLVWCLTVISSL